jgi:hypothetical protein
MTPTAKTTLGDEEVAGLHLLEETRVGWDEVARTLGVSRKSAYRHALKGLVGRSGAVIRLEALKIGQRLITSREAVRRFIARLNVAEPPSPEAAVTHRNRQRQKRAASEAAAKLVGWHDGHGV